MLEWNLDFFRRNRVTKETTLRTIGTYNPCGNLRSDSRGQLERFLDKLEICP